MSGVAVAQTAATRPVIDSAPDNLAYGGGGTIRGHLEGWVAEDVIELQRRHQGSWSPIATRTVDEQGRVRFRLDGMTRTRVYRLVYVDPATEAKTFSRDAKVRVAPRLSVSVSNDNVMAGRMVTVRGRLTGPARPLTIQHRVGGRWRYVDTAWVRDSMYAVRFEVHRAGSHPVRAVFRGDSHNTASKDRTPLRVYNAAPATWYGPGFYGNRTACGQTLGTETLGVAHRTLPCGTEVAVLYKGRWIVVKVIDRGPYSHADWDLTSETAERLRFSGSGTIGVDPGK
jgi:hypothetical protein